MSIGSRRDQVAITIGRRNIPAGDPYVWFRSQGGKETRPGLGDAGTYRTALRIGHLAIDVLGVLDPRADVQVEDPDPRLVRIWPVSSSAIELPAEGFVGIENNDLV